MTAQSDPSLERIIEKEIHDIEKSKKTTVIGTIVLALAMLAYMTWIHGMVNQLLEPDALAGQIQGVVRQNIPQLRGHVRQAMTDRLPLAVDRGFDVATASLPDWRLKVENYVVGKVEKAFDTFHVKFDRQLESELTQLRKDAIREHMKALKSREGARKLEAELAVEFEKRYRQEALSKLLPEFFESWTNVTAAEAMGVFQERLQAFDVELQRLCNTPDEMLAPEEQDKLEMVLCVTAYLESLFADEGDKIVERAFWVFRRSEQKAMQALQKKAEEAALPADAGKEDPPAEPE